MELKSLKNGTRQIMYNVKQLFSKLPHSKNWKFWISAILIIKFVYFFVLIKKFVFHIIPIDGFIGQEYFDTFSYISPINQFLSTGNLNEIVSFRLPGYGIIYLPFRLLLPMNTALNALIILQTIISAISVYCLSLIALKLFQSEKWFQYTLFLYFLIPIISYYDICLLTESLSTSFLIISAYFLLNDFSNKNLFLSGLFLTACIFQKPAFALLLPLFLSYIIFNNIHIKKTIIYSLVFLSFYFVAQVVWTASYFYKYNTLVVFSSTNYYPETYSENLHTEKFMNFIKAYGGDFVDDTEWYYNNGDVVLPDFVYTSKFNLDSLLILKKQMMIAQSSWNIANYKSSENDRKYNNSIVRNKLDLYTNSIKDENPFHYYIGSRMIILKKLICKNPSFLLFGNYSSMSRFLLPFRVISDFCFFFIFILFCLNFYFIFRHKIKNPQYLLIFFIALYFYVVYAIILQWSNFRYVLPSLPFIVICSILPFKYFKSKLSFK